MGVTAEGQDNELAARMLAAVDAWPATTALESPPVTLPARPARRTSWPAADLLATAFPPPRWAVPGLIVERLSLLVGRPKIGKSWLAANCAVAVAAGGMALGRVPVEQGPVIYLALEDPPRRLRARLEMILAGGPPPPGLTFETEWPAVGEGGAELLDRRLDERPETRLVVVDVLARLRRLTDNDRGSSRYEQDYATVATIKAVADAHQVGVVVLHHDRKLGAEDFVDTVSGTAGLAGAADAVLVLRRARTSADAVLHVTGRDIEEAEWALRFDATRGSWLALDGPAGDYQMATTRRRILHLIRERGPMRPKQIAEARPPAMRQPLPAMGGRRLRTGAGHAAGHAHRAAADLAVRSDLPPGSPWRLGCAGSDT